MSLNPFILKSSIILASAVVGTIIGLILRQAFFSPTTPVVPVESTDTNKTTVTPTPSLSLANDRYSLTIPAQRARPYKASHIVSEHAPEKHDGYSQGLVSYESDGLKVFAQVTSPATPRPAEGYPVIILVHGYIQPAAYLSNEPFYNEFAVEYARRGYLVIKPDLRGHGQSWGVPEGAYFSAGYVADILNLSASLPSYAEADTKHVGLIGHSMGGHIALAAALVKPDQFQALVLAAPSAGTLNDLYYNWSAYSDFADPVTTGIRKRVISLFGEPAAGSKFWSEADLYTYLKDLKLPTQIHHSTNDDTVPYKFSTDLEAALKAAGHPADFQTYQAGHSFVAEGRAPFIDSSTDFLNRILKP